MTAKQKKQLSEHLSTLEQIYADIESIKDELQETFDNKSEKWQDSEKGEEASNQLNTFDECLQSIEESKEKISELID